MVNLGSRELPYEMSAPECGSTRSIHSDEVLIELVNHNDQISLVLFGWIVATWFSSRT